MVVKTGWAQIWWLVCGVGSNGSENGRWKLEDFPLLVPRHDNERRKIVSQEMFERRVGASDVDTGANSRVAHLVNRSITRNPVTVREV